MSLRSRHRPWFRDGGVEPRRPRYVFLAEKTEIEFIPLNMHDGSILAMLNDLERSRSSYMTKGLIQHVHVDAMQSNDDLVNRDDIVEHSCFKDVEEFEHSTFIDHEGRNVHRFVITLAKEKINGAS